MELKVLTNVPQGGATLPYSSNEVHFEETNSNIPSIEEMHAIDTYSVAYDRPQKTNKKPTHYTINDKSGLIAYALAVTHEIPESADPSTYSEAISCPNS